MNVAIAIVLAMSYGALLGWLTTFMYYRKKYSKQ